MTNKDRLRMNRPCVVRILMLAALVLGPTAQVSAEEEASAGLERWVPASEAFADGELRQGLFSPEERAQINTWLREGEGSGPPDGPVTREKHATPEGCDLLIVTSAGIESPDVAESLAKASVALTGTVTSLEPGLYRGRLATLVSVEVARWLTAPEAAHPPTVVRFIHGDTRVTIGGRSYCHRVAGRTERLDIGRGVVVATANVLQEEPLLLLPYESELFFETERRGVSAAGPVRGTPPSEWSSFEEWVHRLGEGKGV